MSDDEYGSRRRFRRRQDSDEEEEEEDTFSMRRRGRQREENSDEEDSPRRGRAARDESEEEEDEEEEEDIAVEPGTTIGKMMEAKKKKFHQNLIEGMFKLAEKKYGRKRPTRGEDKGNAMEDYDLYLRSVKAKVKTTQDKLNAVLKQKKDIEAKVAAAEKEFNMQQSKYDKADEEKQNAINESRDPVLPKDFIVPQRAKKANAGLGALVMKASSGMWEEKFAAMKKSSAKTDTPEWMAKQKKSDKTSALLKVGKATTDKKPRRRRKDEDDKPNPFTMNLKKTGLRKEEEDNAKRPARRGRPREDDDE